MKKYYETFGIICSEIAEAKKIVESTLNINLSMHESCHMGGDYFRLSWPNGTYDPYSEDFVLFQNYDRFDKEWIREQFCEYPFILEVEDTERPEEIRSLLGKRQEVLFLMSEFIEK